MSTTKIFNKQRIKKIILVVASIFCFGWYTGNRVFFFQLGLFERVAAGCMYPFLLVSSHVTAFFRHLTEHKKTYQQLAQEHQELQRSYAALQGATVVLHGTAHFNQDTQEILEFKKRYELTNALLAKILVRNISSEEHSVIINRGERDGVKKDMVGIYKLQIVGKIVQVHDYYSKLQLITDTQSKVAAHANATGAGGIIIGSNIPNCCQLNYVSYINAMQPDDLVFSSGQGMVFPEGFCLGKISKLVTNDKALYHDIEVTPLVDLTKITHCLLTDQEKITLF